MKVERSGQCLHNSDLRAGGILNEFGLLNCEPWMQSRPRHSLEVVGSGGLAAQSCQTLWTPWTVASQGPLSMGFPRLEYWNGLPFPPPGDLPDPGIQPTSPELQGLPWWLRG